MMDESVNFQNLSYKELQAIAKRCSLPANMRREVLVEALSAYQAGDLPRVEYLVSLHKTARKRRIVLKPQNLSTSKRRRKSPKSNKSKDESVVDSTSQEVGDMTCFNSASSVFNSGNTGFSDLMENCSSNYLRNKIRMNLSQPHQHITELQQLNAVNMSDDRHCISQAVNYNNQFDLKNSTASSAPFDMLKYSSQQNPMPYYQQPDVASKSFMHYNCGQTYYPTSHSQSTSYSNNCDINYNAGSDNNYQVPNYTRNSSMSVMQCSNTIANQNNCMNVSSLSQSSYYAKDFNNVPVMETDYPSPYLPNIPQLADVTAENTQTSHFPSSWSQDTPHNNEAGKYMYEAQSQGVMSSSQNLNHKPIGATNANFTFRESLARGTAVYSACVATSSGTATRYSCDLSDQRWHFDKYSDEETLSLNEDVANLLDVNKTDHHKLNLLSTCSHSGEAYYIHPNKEYNNASFDHFYTRPDSQSISVETPNGCISACPNQTITYSESDNVSRTGLGLSNLSNYSMDNIVSSPTPLPPISTFFRGTNHNYANNSHQWEPHQVSYCTSLNDSPCTDDTTFASFRSENETSFMDSCYSNVNSDKNDYNCVNLITPTTSPLRSDASNSILRNRLQVNQLPDLEVVSFEQNKSAIGDSSILQTQLVEKAISLKKKTDLSFPRVNKANNKSSSILPVPHSLLLQKSVQGNKLNMNISKVLVKANSEFKEEEHADVKTNVSQFIYHRETLHRSKIVCNFLKEDSIKGENVREFFHMFESAGFPKRKCLGLQPATVLDTMEEDTQKKTNTFRPCVNKKRGCNVILQAESLHKHEKRCLFRLISCPSTMCSWRNSMKLLSEHIYEDHAGEIEKRNQFLFILDRKKFDDRTLHTYYQVHKKTIYVIQLHIEDNKCVVAIQHIPEVDLVLRQEKPASVMMQMYAFCNKIRMRSWTGVTRPYYESGQKLVDVMINVRNSEFVGLRVVIAD